MATMKFGSRSKQPRKLSRGMIVSSATNTGRRPLLLMLVLWLLGSLIVVFIVRVERDALHTMLDSSRQTKDESDHLLSPASSSFSACLVLTPQQDSQHLVEWLAYHYHVLPLRRLIVWRDPLIVSTTTTKIGETTTTPPTTTTMTRDILDRWKDRMDITVWDQLDQIYPRGHPFHRQQQQQKLKQQQQSSSTNNNNDEPTTSHHEKIRARHAHQDIFVGACLRRLQREGQSWTIVSSYTNDYTLINPRLRNVTDPLHDATVVSVTTVSSSSSSHGQEGPTTATTPTTTKEEEKPIMTIPLTIPSQQEPGSVLKWLHTTQLYAPSPLHNNYYNKYLVPYPCIPLTSKQFGTYERTEETGDDNNNDSSSEDHTKERDSMSPPPPTTTATTTTTSKQQLALFAADGRDHDSHNNHLKSTDFLTLRWQYWGHQDHDRKIPMIRSSMVDLHRIAPPMVHWKISAHRPIPHDEICPPLTTKAMHEASSLFVIHHYTGTTEQIHYNHKINDIINNNKEQAPPPRQHPPQPQHDDNNNNGIALGGEHPPLTNKPLPIPLQSQERLHQDTIHNTYHEGNTIPQWLDGFVEQVGLENAKQLLQKADAGYHPHQP